jgi:hypothetical protein
MYLPFEASIPFLLFLPDILTHVHNNLMSHVTALFVSANYWQWWKGSSNESLLIYYSLPRMKKLSILKTDKE